MDQSASRRRLEYSENIGVKVGQELKASAKVLYSIQSGRKTFSRLADCLFTWTLALSKDQLQVIGIAAPPNETGLTKRAHWYVTPCSDTHPGGACKDAYALVLAYLADVDWVVLVGDDNYVVTDNLAEVLSGTNASEPMVLGIKGCGKCMAGGLCGGGGQIFSRGALERFMSGGTRAFLDEAAAQAEASGMWGDVVNCREASKHGVPVRSLPGLHGWAQNSSLLESSVRSENPRPLTFHYVNGSREMNALHKHVLDRHNKLALVDSHSRRVLLAESYVSAEYAQGWNAYVSRESQKRQHVRKESVQ
jgi:hypothetical protein